MKILFITDNFPPEVNAPATRSYEHCVEWVKKGINVTVITCTPNDSDGNVYKGYKNTLYKIEYMNGIKVVRVWTYIASERYFISRIVDYFSFAFMSLLAGLFIKTDIIIATSPQFFTTWSASLLSKLKRIPWVFEVRDLWPASIIAVGAMKEGIIIDLLEKIELSLYRDSNKVIVVTESFQNNLVIRGINKEKISVITNGSNLDLFYSRDKDDKLIGELKLKNKFVVGYIGTHGMAHSLEFIINAIAKVKDKNIHFIFIGNGVMKQSIITMSNKLRLNNITFLEPVSKERIADYISIIDVSLAPLKKDDTFKKVIPSKIFEASAMLKPTLLGVEGQAQDIIEKYEAGICFEPENENDFLEKLYILKDDKEFYKKCQDGCHKLSSDFDRKILADKMLDIIKSI